MNFSNTIEMNDSSLKINSVVISNIGKVRSNNEDNFFICGEYRKDVKVNNSYVVDNDMHAGYLYAVFDGMGGHNKGEQASLIAAQTLERYKDIFFDKVEDFVSEANENINFFRNENHCNSGTTFAGLAIRGTGAVIANVGDSRIYRFRNKKLKQLSEDHTQVNFLIRSGIIKEQDSYNRPEKHVLTQNLGIDEEDMVIEPYIEEILKIESGDLFLLCSDGLTDMLSDDEIEDIIQKFEPLEDKAKMLIDSALNKGGKDNVTVLLVEV